MDYASVYTGVEGGAEHAASDVRDRAGAAQPAGGLRWASSGHIDTGLSAPFQANVPEGKLFTPDFAAARLLEVVDRLKPDHSGKVFAWDGQTIPP